MGWVMARVYVSSTISDLKSERRAVMGWLVAAGHQPVHSYRPGSDTVQASSLGDVASCDLYVLIAGHRYGSQPEDGNPDRLSITHLEFRRAGQAGIPRVALLRTSIPDERLSDMADPERLALVLAFRAQVAREVRAAEFHDEASLLQGLSTGVQAELAKLGRQPAGDQAAGRRAEGPVLRLAPRPEVLAGREELLAGLHDRLAGGEGSGPRVVALCGMGGVGKTSVAVEYAHRHLAEVGVVWQLPAEDATVLAAGFAELAAQLGVRGATGGNPVAAVHSALAAYPGEWLLIFDNAPGQGPVRAFMPPAGNGRVLITSQSAVWPRDQKVEVPVLGTEVAAVFLVTRAGDPDSQAAAALAQELGGLPLALEQAAAYIQAAGTTLAGYLAVFGDRRADLLTHGEAAGHPADVAATLGLALSRLEAEAPAAVGLLRLLACLAPEPVPLALLLSHPPVAGDLDPGVAAVVGPLLGAPVAAWDAVAALRGYSLVTPAGDGLMLVHRLVQRITMAQLDLGMAEDWRCGAAALIEAALPKDPENPAGWPVLAALLPHAQAALTYASYGMDKIAAYLRAIGNYGRALDLQQQILTACDLDLGAEHPRTLAARASLATLTGEGGAPAAARDQFAELLPALTRVLGAEHPRTLTARASLAYWTGETGAQAAARVQFAELLPVLTRVLGAEDGATLTARGNLARSTGDAGDAAAARDKFAALLPIRERVSGGRHPSTLIVRASLAYWTGMAGDPAAARDQYAELVPIREELLGAEHPRTLVARANLARWTGEAGDPASARDQYAKLLPLLERVLGAEHPATRDARASLA